MYVLVIPIVLGPLLAWWPGKMPRAIRMVAACLALAPVVLALAFAFAILIRRPGQLVGPVGPILVTLAMAAVAGAYSLWPSATPRQHRPVAAIFFVGPILGLAVATQLFMIARAGTVVGKVTFKGQPVPSGRVSILGDGGVVCTGVIRPDGRYTVYRVPAGPIKIAVATYPPAPPGPVPLPAAQYVAIPPRYRDFSTSNLSFVVAQGGQRHNLDLQP
jgi:hypothetical protein